MEELQSWLERDRPVRNTGADSWPTKAPEVAPIEDLLMLDRPADDMTIDEAIEFLEEVQV
jgi:hypothetical protein